ncbi:molybdenum transport protein [Desulfuromusa kysingii]|uniref:Putative pyrophosphorylase ModD n=1 Tax=Desulfuromusa kysingii TaxID=37625 RepID=A0A1H3X427_9BACT|nr:ModD protein [Desulfuromusa kysingii]SDZ94146.1 molybdenum transport protein [Desulfuromusa kysingii]
MLFHDDLINKLLTEDVPYGDLTTEEMGISGVQGEMIFRARFDCVLAGADEAAAILKKLGAELSISAANGKVMQAGDHIMTAKANAGILHKGWKVAQNIMEHATGIATRTAAMVAKGRAINPDLIIACTRKSFPGGKTICMNAVLAGGGTPHRLGISETFLLFSNHSNFFPDEQSLLAALTKAVKAQPEKKLTVECEDLDFAEKAIKAGAGNIQFDKVKADKLHEYIPYLRQKYPYVTLEAAGGINIETVAEYAMTGIDVAVTSFVYTGKPMDIEVVIRPV